MPNVFSVPIFFIVFRETLEAAIIISVLLGIVEQIANTRLSGDTLPVTESEKEEQNTEAPPSLPSNNNDDASSDDGERKKLLRKLRIQVYYSSTSLVLHLAVINRAYLVFCLLDFHRFRRGFIDRSRDRRGVHRRLVYSSFRPLEKI